MDFESEHKLSFEARKWWVSPDKQEFRVGTCEGVFYNDDKNYIILAIVNSFPGNGHFNDVLQWFENSCKRDNKNLVFECILNEEFKKHLIKIGFINCIEYEDSLIKIIK